MFRILSLSAAIVLLALPSLAKPEVDHCGCARPRLLRTQKAIHFDAGYTHLAAWVRRDGSALLETFAREAEGNTLRPVESPFLIESFAPPENIDLVETKYELVHLFPKSEEALAEPLFVGLLRPPKTAPGDVVRIEPLPLPPTEDALLGNVSSLWLGPLYERERKPCTKFLSHRIVLESPAKMRGPVALWVEKRVAGQPIAGQLIDVRHARLFGIGSVGPCDHGLPIESGKPAAFTIFVVDESFQKVGPWLFETSGVRGEHPRLVGQPEGIDQDEDDNPFLHPIRDPVEEIMSHDADYGVLGGMIALMSSAVIAAFALWRGRRKQKVAIEKVTCPGCEHEMELDLGDPESDGLFCPSCGEYSIFVGQGADGTPRAHVIKLAAGTNNAKEGDAKEGNAKEGNNDEG